MVRKSKTIGGMGAPGSLPAAPGAFSAVAAVAAWKGNLLVVSVSATPPSPMGTTAGAHLYYEDPDQSAGSTLKLDGTTALDGSSLIQGNWAPEDQGQYPYIAAEQPWTFTIADPLPGTSIRVYVQAYGTNFDPVPVRCGQAGATPSSTFTVPPYTAKEGSGVEYEPLVGGITADYPLKQGATMTDQVVTGKKETPVAVYVDLSNLASLPHDFAFAVIGVWDNDPTAAQMIFGAPMSAVGADNMVPLAVQDSVTVPHSFLLDTPTTVRGLTLFAVSLRLISPRAPTTTAYVAGKTPRPGGKATEQWNTIVPGVTPSVHIEVGTTAGTTDFGSALTGSFSSEFHVVNGVWTMEHVDMSKASNLSSQFAMIGDVQTVTNLAANLIVTGELQIGGGANRMSLVKQFDALTGNTLTGIIGDDRPSAANPNGTGFFGAWFKGPFGVGGPDPLHPNFWADSVGNVFITNAWIAGNLIVGSVGSASYASISGVAATFNGTVQCSQLAAGTINAKISITAPIINGATINASFINGDGGSITVSNSMNIGATTIFGPYSNEYGSHSTTLYTPTIKADQFHTTDNVAGATETMDVTVGGGVWRLFFVNGLYTKHTVVA